MGKPNWWKEANELWWLTDEEIEHYGIDRDPERRRDFLSLRAFHKRMRYDINDKDQWVILDNKWFFANFCKGLGLPHPEVYGVLASPQGRLADGSPLRSVSDLVNWCRQTGKTRLVLKPIAGGASVGVFVIDEIDWHDHDPMFHVAGRGVLSAQDLSAQLVTSVPWHQGTEGVLVQELARPHEWCATHDLGPFTIIRIVTFVPEDGEAVLQSAILLCGRTGKVLNRFSSGALSIHIDHDIGVLGTGRTLPTFGREELSTHPDTGTAFTGLTLPDWQETKDLALQAARMTVGMRLVCWEVLLTDTGPQLLEGNWGFGLTILQAHGDGFLKNGVADMWKQAGADLPDGTRDWVKRTAPPLATRAVRKARRMLGR